MIGKVTRKRMDGGSSFKRLIEYIEEAKKADWHMTSDNIVSLQGVEPTFVSPEAKLISQAAAWSSYLVRSDRRD
jgi:hypothetical protein